jgi:hypothetical protein
MGSGDDGGFVRQNFNDFLHEDHCAVGGLAVSLEMGSAVVAGGGAGEVGLPPKRARPPMRCGSCSDDAVLNRYST